MSDLAADFRDAVAAAGIKPPEFVEADGQLHRFSMNGKSGDDAGWYVLHADGIPAGMFGCHRRDITETRSARKPSDMTPDERTAHRRRIAETKFQRDAERERIHAEARKGASEIWQRAQPETGEHRYLRDKGVNAYGIRSDGERLIVPMHDTAGTLHSVQYIDPRGDKRYLSGGRVSGCYHAIGKPNRVLCVCEGYATGASIHEATGHAVAVAFDAGNLKPVAQSLRTKYPDLRLVICADNDIP